MSASAATRARAAQIVAQVIQHGHSLDTLLDEEDRAARSATRQSPTPQQRGLLRSLCYDSVRWYLRLDALLARLLTRPGQQLDPQVHALAIVGLCQLLHTDIPAHAVIDETVNAVRVLGQPRAAGLLNAVLRRCQREGATLTTAIDADHALRTAHPRWLVDALGRDWQEGALPILAQNNRRPPMWLRVNRLRVSGPEYRARLEAAGMNIAASACGDEALLLERAADVHDLPGFGAGWVSVQDAAAQWAARLLEPQAGQRVLDACAAPGGKTCHILELQPELAELTAVDVSAARLQRVAENLERLGLRARLVAGDAADPTAWWDGRPFERILLDVPCSATGVIRRHPDIKVLRRPEDITAFAARQGTLLDRVWPLLAAGGRLVYASCSALRAENADVVDAFLARCPQPAREITSAVARSFGIDAPAGTGYAIAAGTAGMDGFYYACLEKTKG